MPIRLLALWVAIFLPLGALAQDSAPGDSDPALYAEVQAWFDSLDGNPGDRMLEMFDIEGGFVWLPDNYEEPIVTEAALRDIAGRYGEAYVSSDMERTVLAVRDHGNGLISAITQMRGTSTAKDRPPRYFEWRSSWLLERRGDGFVAKQSMDGLMGLFRLIPRLYERAAPGWAARERGD